MTETRPPRARKIPHELTAHGEQRTDPWHWLRDKTNPEVIALLNAENAYTESILAPHKDVRESLFEELKKRIKEDDQGVPVYWSGYWYYTRVISGHQYAIHCRKKGSLDATEEVILDENELARGQSYFSLGVCEVSPDQKWLAYSVDIEGNERHVLRFKELATGRHSTEEIPDTGDAFEWASDNRTCFYVLKDEHDRPDRLVRHRLGTDSAEDVVVYREDDPKLFVSFSKSKSQRFLFLELYGHAMCEYRFLEADRPEGDFQVIEPRRQNHLYHPAHHGESFYIVTNDTETNFRRVKAPIEAPGEANWREIRRGGPELYIEGVECFQDHLVIFERERGQQRARIVNLPSFTEHTMELPEPSYSIGSGGNPEWTSKTFRFSYTSMVTPQTVFDYHMDDRSLVTKKVREVPGGYDPKLYASERIDATAPDGTKVPITLVYKRSTFKRDGKSPLYLYGYGSYGHPTSPGFSTSRLSLLDRGFVFALGHVRGGSDLGRHWYEDGKFLKKTNTFTDFIACAEHLIQERYTSKGSIVISGGSAGGLLVGACLNMRPELFRGAVAHVPFVDVLNTMLDETLPLTPLEYDEWGNPNDKAYYDAIKAYSPYDNVRATNYPHLLVTAGLNDPRVTYWEPAKWVQKLRDLKTDSNLLLLHTHMDAGHGGASGRYDALKDIALEYTFVLKIFNLLP